MQNYGTKSIHGHLTTVEYDLIIFESASHSAVLVRYAFQDFYRGIDDGISPQNPGGRFHVLRTNFKFLKFFVGQMCTFQISNLVYEIPDHSHQINNLRLGMHFSFQVLYITFLA